METIQYPKEQKAKKDHKCNFCEGTILKGETYLRSLHKYDGVYAWKTHLQCSDIADKLRMYDWADEGVTTEMFIESIKCEYQDLMSKYHNEIYESKDFIYPNFQGQLAFVIGFHKVLTPNKVTQ